MKWQALVLFLGLVAGCGEGATSDPGTNALLRVADAQFATGEVPNDGGGPKVTAIDNSRNQITIGETKKPLKGTLEPAARAVLIGLEGDSGHWILPAAPPDVATPGFPTFDVVLAFSTAIPPGVINVRVAAVDAADRVGPVRAVQLEARPLAATIGAYVVRLTWDTEADLDLHVVDADRVEIWARSPTSFRSPDGSPPTPQEKAKEGFLDVDSNAACTLDGRRMEQVIWTRTPTVGTYSVRVDAFSLCAESAARWTVSVLANGEEIARAQGIATETDTRGAHDAGAGVLALSFEVER